MTPPTNKILIFRASSNLYSCRWWFGWKIGVGVVEWRRIGARVYRPFDGRNVGKWKYRKQARQRYCIALRKQSPIKTDILKILSYTTIRQPENCLTSYEPHGYCVIYSSADRASFILAERIIQSLWTSENIAQKAVILVGNKADLARSRCVTTEGKN